jgi:hypothetical protein
MPSAAPDEKTRKHGECWAGESANLYSIHRTVEELRKAPRPPHRGSVRFAYCVWRALIVLERIGTSEARRRLEEAAKGPPPGTLDAASPRRSGLLALRPKKILSYRPRLSGWRQLDGIHPPQHPVQFRNRLVDVFGLRDQRRRHQDQAAARHHMDAFVPGPPADLQRQR